MSNPIIPQSSSPVEGDPGYEIHPEIPRADWVTERFSDDDGGIVVDEHEYYDGIFNVTVNVTHSINTDGGARTGPLNLLVRWRNAWPGENAMDRESFCVLPSDIPALIAALQRAEAVMAR